MRVSTALVAGSVAIAWCVTDGGAVQVQQASDTSIVRARDDTKGQRLFGELMSPFCPGLTLATCPSPGADSLRWDIRTRLSRGETPRSIRASYVADWGEQILGAPPVRNWGAVLWVTPAVALGLGAVGLTLWLRSQRRRPDAAETEAVTPAEARASPAERALKERLEAELRAFDDAN